MLLAAADGTACLNALPDKFRVPIVLTYYSEFNYDQIADIFLIGDIVKGYNRDRRN